MKIKMIFIPFLLLFITSCSLRTAKVSGPEKTSAENEEGIALLRTLKLYNDKVKTVKGSALAVFRENENTVSLKTEIVTDKKEKKFRIDLSDFVFKVPLITIIRNNNEILAVVHNKKEYYTLAYENFDFRNMTGINIPKDILVGSMTGGVYLIEGETAVSSPKDLLLSIESENGKQLVKFNDESLPVEAQYLNNTDICTVKYEKYKKIDGINYPYRIIIKNGDGQLEINYSDIKLNRLLESNAFELVGLNLNEYRHVN